ncbi:MAG: YegP family protein [Nocardioides sp.]|uniref:YegP family protein n=1 Tax=Nocardioides sp. TaxID=35761 RepID=UPI0039E367A8
MLKIAGLFEVYALDGEHYWLLRDWDGQIMARNGGYPSRGGALMDIERLRVTALTANVVEV